MITPRCTIIRLDGLLVYYAGASDMHKHIPFTNSSLLPARCIALVRAAKNTPRPTNVTLNVPSGNDWLAVAKIRRPLRNELVNFHRSRSMPFERGTASAERLSRCITITPTTVRTPIISSFITEFQLTRLLDQARRLVPKQLTFSFTIICLSEGWIKEGNGWGVFTLVCYADPKNNDLSDKCIGFPRTYVIIGADTETNAPFDVRWISRLQG